MELIHNYGDSSNSNSDSDIEAEEDGPQYTSAPKIKKLTPFSAGTWACVPVEERANFQSHMEENSEKKKVDMDCLNSFGTRSSNADQHPNYNENKADSVMSSEETNADCDFFGIQDWQTSSKRSTGSAVHLSTSRSSVKSHIQNGIQVPEGEFWSDFIPNQGPDSDHGKLHTSHDSYYRRQIEESVEPDIPSSFHHTNCILPNTASIESSKISKNKGFFRAHVRKYSNHPYFSFHSKGVEAENSQVSKTNLTMPGPAENKKVFYVHSKVAPLLHSYFNSKLACKASASWCAHDGAVNRLNWNQPNFSHLLVTSGMDSRICVWNVWSSHADQCVAVLTCHKKAVKHAEWCQGGRSIFSCSYDRTAQISDVENGQTKVTLDHVGFVTAGCLHSSNPNLVVTGTDNMAFMWDIRTPQAPVKHFSYKETFGQVQDLAFISEDRELVSCADHVSRDSADRSILIWDVRSTAVLSNQVFQERYTCTRLKLHREKSYFLAQTHGGYIALFSTSSPYRMEKGKRFGGHKLLGYSIGFDMSPDGKLVYSGSAEGGVHCYDYRTGKLMHKLISGRNDIYMDVACHPVLSSVLATCTWGGNIKLWQ
ncbi:WD repeat-containing protein 25 [Plakobranchus ocellatus]|uniref:WD repeat-containing protein 25 n=1 Tax=Plakobranchus ocellatus TaxID=259542 RepID=A0AAV4DWR4_9GAST|nr:WD repeat-containing protein 25 [Plakobranchus ocellatus]